MQDGVTILGASGFIGTRLVRRLAQRGARRIIAVDREPPRERLDGVDYVQADVRDPLDPEMAFPGGTLSISPPCTARPAILPTSITRPTSEAR